MGRTLWSKVCPLPVAQNPRRPVGRTRNHGRADLLLSWSCRARPYRPAPCARYRSPVPLVRFCRGVALRPAVAGARAGLPGLCGIVRAAPTLPACGLVGVLGAFPGGPAGRWRVSFANPLWCGLVLGPSLVGGCVRGAGSVRPVGVCVQPVLLKYAGRQVCRPGGLNRPPRACGAGPPSVLVAGSAAPASVGLAPMGRPARPGAGAACAVSGGVGGRWVGAPPVSACPQTGRPRAKCGACAPVCRGRRGPGGRARPGRRVRLAVPLWSYWIACGGASHRRYEYRERVKG